MKFLRILFDIKGMAVTLGSVLLFAHLAAFIYNDNDSPMIWVGAGVGFVFAMGVLFWESRAATPKE